MSYVETLKAFAHDEPGGDKILAGPATIEHVATMLSPLVERVKTLERRLAEVEAKGIRYGGVWQRAAEYTRGTVATHKGSAWVTIADTTRAEPGASNDWQLMVKAGRDAA